MCHYFPWFIIGDFNIKNDCTQGSIHDTLPAHCSGPSQGLSGQHLHSASKSSVCPDNVVYRVNELGALVGWVDCDGC